MNRPVLDLTGTGRRVVVGIGTRRGVSMTRLRTALVECLAASGVRTRDIGAIVTADAKANEPALQELSELLAVPLSFQPPEELGRQQVPNPSSTVARVAGTPSVAEAAVLAAGAQLIAPKYSEKGVTIALGVLAPHPSHQHTDTTIQTMAGRLGGNDHIDLDHHGDAEVAPGLVDLAVNVRPGGPPLWLSNRLHQALDRVGAYPDRSVAIAAVAARHQRPVGQVLLTGGGAEAFVLLARALRPDCAVIVHPQFTEPEAALLAAGYDVHRLELPPPFTLDPSWVPEQADLVIVGNPTNPTSVLHPAADLITLARPGRVLVVDEAFMDAVTGQAQSLAGSSGAPPVQIPGLVVIRSLTKTWGVPGLRVGYAVGDPDVLAEMAGCQPLWPVSTLALEALIACSQPEAQTEAERYALEIAASRAHLVQGLSQLGGVDVVPDAQASFVLFQVQGTPDVHTRLRLAGWAVRRADTFPGLGPGWLRVAVRDRSTTDMFVQALARILADEIRLDSSHEMETR